MRIRSLVLQTALLLVCVVGLSFGQSNTGISLYYRVEPLEPAPTPHVFPLDTYETATTTALGPYEFGFDFTLWGTTYKAFFVCSNGWIAMAYSKDDFGPGGCERAVASEPIPREDSLVKDLGVVAVWQTAQDYEAGEGPSVAVATTADLGTGKKVHVRWANCSVSVPADPTDTLADFQVTFQEEGNTITFLYIDTPGTNTPVLAGIQDDSQSKAKTIPDGNARQSFPIFIDKAYVMYDWTNNMLLYGGLALVGGVVVCLVVSVCCSFAAARARKDAHNMHKRSQVHPPHHVDGSGKNAHAAAAAGRGPSSASKGSRRGAGAKGASGSLRGGSKGSRRGSKRVHGGSNRSKGSNRRPKVEGNTFAAPEPASAAVANDPHIAVEQEPLVNEE